MNKERALKKAKTITRSPASRSATSRSLERMALILIFLFAVLVFFLANTASQIRQGKPPFTGLPEALLPPLIVMIGFASFHLFLKQQKFSSEQILIPVICLLLCVGLVIIWRLKGSAGTWHQVGFGLLPGLIAAAGLIARPLWIDWIKRRAVRISVLGLALPVLTGLFGVVDETGARFALKLGLLPAVQVSEPLKLFVIIFLAWYIGSQEQVVGARTARPPGRLWLPAFRYLFPGICFVVVSTLVLVLMGDYGTVPILGCIFLAMLYVGFEPRTSIIITAVGLVLILVMGLILSATWNVPGAIQGRFQAYMDPWSKAMLVVDGQPSGITIADGPGYPIQQAIYAVVAGGASGSGLGFGSPNFVPLGDSENILAAVVEEMGAIIGIALLFLFAVLFLRILRASMQTPPGQVFERLLLIGISVHLFAQGILMTSGTVNLLPVAGLPLPFLSLGGLALLTHLTEIGIVLAVIRRQE